VLSISQKNRRFSESDGITDRKPKYI